MPTVMALRPAMRVVQRMTASSSATWPSSPQCWATKRTKPVEDELRSPVAHAHRPLEAQEVLRVLRQPGGGHDRGHVGTGRETSRSDSVAIRTYAEIDP